MRIPTLVIACGNRLRGDDGAGPSAADVVESWRLPGVKVVVVQQLVPELIEEMKDAERVLFVDAAVNRREDFAAGIIEPRPARRALGHCESPSNLLALSSELEGRATPAWLLTISGISFEHGERLTSRAAANVQAALAWIRNWACAGPLTD